MRCGGGKVPNIYRDLDLSLKEDWVNLVDCPGCEDCRCDDCDGKGLETVPFPDGEDAFGYGSTHDILGSCLTCHGTGRKVSDERSIGKDK